MTDNSSSNIVATEDRMYRCCICNGVVFDHSEIVHVRYTTAWRMTAEESRQYNVENDTFTHESDIAIHTPFVDDDQAIAHVGCFNSSRFVEGEQNSTRKIIATNVERSLAEIQAILIRYEITLNSERIIRELRDVGATKKSFDALVAEIDDDDVSIWMQFDDGMTNMMIERFIDTMRIYLTN